MAREQQPPTTNMSRLPGDTSATLDQPEDDDYFRHLANRVAMLRPKFSLSALMFIVACLGVIFAPLQFVAREDLPTVCGLAVLFLATLIVLAIVITPGSSRE
jgi:hypothetical protein